MHRSPSALNVLCRHQRFWKYPDGHRAGTGKFCTSGRSARLQNGTFGVLRTTWGVIAFTLSSFGCIENLPCLVEFGATFGRATLVRVSNAHQPTKKNSQALLGYGALGYVDAEG